MQEMKLNDFFPEWATGKGIFYFLDRAATTPWRDVLYENTLSFDYHGNNSGSKYPAPIVIYAMEDSQTDSQRSYLAQVIIAQFLKKWVKLWNTFSLQYNPIENYSMTETESGNIHVAESVSGTGNETYNIGHTETATGTDTGTIQTGVIKSGSDTTSKTGKETKETWSTGNSTGNSENGIFGFNTPSSTSVPHDNSETETESIIHTVDNTSFDNRSDSISTSENSNQTETRNLADSESKTTVGTDTKTTSNSDNKIGDTTNSKTLTRSGNIGVTTSQQMIQAERELWMYDFFKETVYKDIDSVLTLDIY